MRGQRVSSTNAQGTGRPNGAAGAPTTITSIPLTDAHPPGDATVGSLVRDATVHMSTLVRAEVELAKTEVVAEAKKALIGSVFFIVALVVLLFSSFFFFFFLADLFTLWMPRWVASLLVFVLMLVTAGLSAGIGVWRVMKIRAPSKTISSLKKVSEVLPTHHGDTEPRLT
ncbi:MAG: phage holin family protein [Mycobacteriaceae bacterium]|nr:phage holin family protein [Mycobacteriaceae bacterium]